MKKRSHYQPFRSSKVVRGELEHMQRVRLRWAKELESHGALYRARDGRLWGLPALKRGEQPGFFIEYGACTEHNPLGEIYPKSWQQLEDERGMTNWLSDPEQELITIEYLESLVAVPTAGHAWMKVERVETPERTASARKTMKTAIEAVTLVEVKMPKKVSKKVSKKRRTTA